jgi:hypothetical protein
MTPNETYVQWNPSKLDYSAAKNTPGYELHPSDRSAAPFFINSGPDLAHHFPSTNHALTSHRHPCRRAPRPRGSASSPRNAFIEHHSLARSSCGTARGEAGHPSSTPPPYSRTTHP